MKNKFLEIIFLSAFCLFLISSQTFSQTVVLQEVVADTASSSFGVNKTHFIHFYGGYQFVAGENHSGSEVKYGPSGGFKYGLRYKYKVNGLISTGFDLGYHGTNYNLVQKTGKLFDSNLHKEEYFSFSAFEAGLYGRINFDVNRGNYMGKFLDIGLAYNRNIRIAHVFKDHLTNGNDVETSVTKLNFVNYNTFYALARLGINKYIFTASYRMNPLFKNLSDFPPFLIGVELGFY